MSFFKKIFGGGGSEAPVYSNFEEGDIFYTNENGKYNFFKVLKVENDNNTLHVLMYEEKSDLPSMNQVEQFKARVYHVPIDKNGFANPKLFLKSQVQDADLLGYHEYLKQTQNINEIVSNAKKYYKEAHDLTTGGNHLGAIHKYSIAINLLPNFFEAIDNRAFCKMDLGMFPEAIEDFQQSLSVSPGRLLPVFSIGECYLKLGNLQNAKNYFEKAIEISPSHDKPKEFLKLTLDLMNK